VPVAWARCIALAIPRSIAIAAIYGIERGGETPALVMELVEGRDLSTVIGGGAVPLDEAPPQPVTRINLVLNWFEELTRVAPGR
jgi:hypothetical protein